jgi:hypothetical protein
MSMDGTFMACSHRPTALASYLIADCWRRNSLVGSVGREQELKEYEHEHEQKAS